MDNSEILKTLREIQANIDDQRAAGPLPIPAELRSGSTADPATRAKVLHEYTAQVNLLPPGQWTKEQRKLVEEQIASVLATL